MTMKKKEQTVLEDLIRAFYFNESQKKEFASLADDEKAKIKKIMHENELTDYVVDDLKAKYYSSVSESFDEEMLLEVLKKNGITNCIKTVEVVDMEALENAIYHHEISNGALKEMDKCRTTKTTYALKISKVKS